MADIKRAHLVGLVEVLEKINTKIKVNHPVEDDVYEWCQSQALDLGNYLEAVYSQNQDIPPVITLLEDYCEQIYKLSLTQEPETRRQIAQTVETELTAVKEAISQIVPE